MRIPFQTHRLALTALVVVAALPSAASAATVSADTERRSGAVVGPVTFRAGGGERNVVSVTQANRRLRFHDDSNRVRARGDCAQVDARTAMCPVTEDVAKVRLGNRDDSAKVEGLVTTLGGTGDDDLRGSRRADILNGQSDADRLMGRGGRDRLVAGPGLDTVLGGAGDDDLVDGETDARALADVFRGGRSRDTGLGTDRGDLISYSLRKDGLEVDLGAAGFYNAVRGPDGDLLDDLESVVGGFGDDRLLGDDDDNMLMGNDGDDVLRGGAFDDTLLGGDGDDDLGGGGFNDVVSGDAGTDALNGGSEYDELIANDASADTVSGGPGLIADDARVTRIDTLRRCRVAISEPLRIRVQPQIEGDTATFDVACEQLGGCDGTLSLNGPNGEDFGSGDFAGLPFDPETFTPVAVQLTEPAVQALADGVTVQVAHGDTGGYRAFMRSG